ncbi:MAG: hypothetical protein WD448_06750 [Woeseia sp.]
MSTTDPEKRLDEFLAEHRLPPRFRRLVEQFHFPLADWIARQPRPCERPLLIGISGAQGTGKSTLAGVLKLILESAHGWRVAALSLDDFYLTHAERQRLAVELHPLLAMRGVPGTHDLPMLHASLAGLQALRKDQVLRIPTFDKASDDRRAPEDWAEVSGPLQAILLEGWCIGSRAQAEEALAQPVNALERERDPTGEWRRFVNAQLAGPYAQLFEQLDRLVWLRAPSFAAAHRWRMEQEQKLAARSSASPGAVMCPADVGVFLQYFERITRADFHVLPRQADAVLELDEQHDATQLRFR